jgi:HlyD family secretion protein
LVRQKVIDVQSRDEALRQFEGARAARDEADAKHKSAEALLTESKARSNKAQTEVAAARNRLQLAIADERRVAALLSYSHITAPFDGVVSVRNVDTQHFVQPSSGPLFVVVRMDKVRVFVDVPETDAILIKYGSKNACVARIKVPALNDREFIGNVVGSSWALEPGQHTLRTEIDFDNPDGSLRPHMYVRALIDETLPDAWMIPSPAIMMRDGQTFGFLLENGKAVKTPVKVGGREGDVIQLMKRQLPAAKPGTQPEWVDIAGSEAFILDNVSELRDGQEVSAEVPTKNR